MRFYFALSLLQSFNLSFSCQTTLTVIRIQLFSSMGAFRSHSPRGWETAFTSSSSTKSRNTLQKGNLDSYDRNSDEAIRLAIQTILTTTAMSDLYKHTKTRRIRNNNQHSSVSNVAHEPELKH